MMEFVSIWMAIIILNRMNMVHLGWPIVGGLGLGKELDLFGFHIH